MFHNEDSVASINRLKMIALMLLCFVAVNAGPPVLLEDYEIKINEIANVFLEIKCSASGDPKPTLEWQNEYGVKLGPHSIPPIWIMNGEEGEFLFSVLIFNLTSKDHSGGYVCVAENSHGMRSKVYVLNITDAETEDAVEVLNVTDTSVAFHIVGEYVTLDIKYTEKRENLTYRLETSEKEVVVRNLIPSGSYTIEFSLKRSEEVDLTFNLTVVLLPARPDVIFHNLRDGLVTIGWFRVFDDFMRKTIDKYRLDYTRVSQVGGRTWQYSDCTVSVEIPQCATPRYTLANLERNQYYEISLMAHTSSGYGAPYLNKIYVTF